MPVKKLNVKWSTCPFWRTCHKAYLPIRIAPKTSKIVARMQAARSVRTPEPTEVPKELATSLAPTPKARMKDTMKPATTKGYSSSENGSMMPGKGTEEEGTKGAEGLKKGVSRWVKCFNRCESAD